MNSFIILSFLATTALAAPAQLGYEYGPGVTTQYVSTTSGSGDISGRIGLGGIGVGGVHYHRQPNLPPVITKNFYVHTAPEETEQEIHQDLITIGQPHKHYNVVFIKAPKHSLRASARAYAQQVNEERTAIYVLSKKPDIHEIQTALQDIPHHPHKPKVYFIKYQTPEEAQHAQAQIQSQYDQLGGTSRISYEGVAPTTSVIGSLGGGAIVGDAGVIGGGELISSDSGNIVSTIGGSTSTGTSYLPAQE